MPPRLGIPRELRNQILEYIVASVRESPQGTSHPEARTEEVEQIII